MIKQQLQALETEWTKKLAACEQKWQNELDSLRQEHAQTESEKTCFEAS